MVFLLLTLNIFHTFYSVSFGDFEQLNVLRCTVFFYIYFFIWALSVLFILTETNSAKVKGVSHIC